MQNFVDSSDEFMDQNEGECDKQFADDVINYQTQVENIIAWLFGKEEELQQRPQDSTLQDAAFSQVLDEYSIHEKFISEFSEYCHTIMKCKEDGQEMRENDAQLTEEDRDEIGIQMDAMMVCYEKLKILATDRLKNLQRIVEERQQTKIERFEEWLSAIEMRIASSNNIGPDYNAVSRQLKDLLDLRVELEQKQDFLNFMSSVIIFDEVDSEFQLRSRSCESLDQHLENMNQRWTEICRFVDDREDKLKKAESIWKLLILEGPQLTNWLKKIERSLSELAEAVRNQPDKVFIVKLLSRSDKIDSEIKSKQSFYTSLESRVRTEIEKFDDPCSMLVIELEKKLEDMQDNWNAIMNRKRMLDYSLQALSNPKPTDRISMIPLPDPITSTSRNNINFDNPRAPSNEYVSSDLTNELVDGNIKEHLSNSSSSANDDKEFSIQMNGSDSDPRAFDTSLSSTTRSLLYGTNNDQDQTLYNNNNLDYQDELSSTSMTASYPTNIISSETKNDTRFDTNLISSDCNQHELHSNYANNQISFETEHYKEGPHSCRVEEWKHSLESFSTWLKRIETTLCIENTLDTMVEPNDIQQNENWSRIDLHRQLLLLNETESQILSTCQDEFDCLILQGQQIIEDLIPEIGENEYEANLKEILNDIEIRYSTVKRCIDERRREFCDRGKWYTLLKSLQESCNYLIDQMGQVIPETNIGVDLITIAQQQDSLMHAKADLEDNVILQSDMKEAKLFLKLCESLQQYIQKQPNQPPLQLNIQDRFGRSSTVTSNNDIWMSFKDLKDSIESQLDRLTLHYSELSQLIEDRLMRLDEVHKEMHALQHKMQELATKLQVAEILKSNWMPLENLSIEKLSEQLEDLKLFRERISETESIHKIMNSIFDWMTKSEVPLSQQNLKRISELNTIWNLIQVSVEERQKLIEQAFDNQGASEQKFLTQTIADLPRWDRRVASSRVPYFVDHNSNSTNWDHPKFTDLFKTMSTIKNYVFSAYRTAIKLRQIQRKFGIDMLMLETLKEMFNLPYYGLGQQQNEVETNQQPYPSILTSNDSQLGVEQIIFYLKAIYEKIQNEEKPSLDVPLSIDLTLNWLLNLYDS